jgi:hypothetical protein
MKATVDADIAILNGRQVGKVVNILFNLGVNDVWEGLPDETTWKADVLYILDAFKAVNPDMVAYVMRPWIRGRDAYCGTLADWIDDVVAARPTWVHLGPDERIWLKGADDGATMTYDGIHYSAAGNAECAAQWQTTLGY